MSINDKITICPKCVSPFEIDKNRVYKVRSNSLLWFADAINQFEHFNEVQCPSCGFKYKAKEAKLFSIFNSIYPVVAISIIFAFLVMLYLFFVMR